MKGHLHKVGNSWKFKFRVNGKQKKITFGAISKHEVERASRITLDEIERNFFKDLKKATFSELREKWLAYIETSGLKKKTIDNYKERLRVHVTPYFENMLVAKITPDVIEDFKAKMMGREVPVSGKTLNYDLLVLGMVLKKAVHWGYLYRNPMEMVSKLKTRKKEFPVLTREQVKKLLEVAEKIPSTIPGQSKTILMTAVMSGLREAEILGMRWQNVDLKNETYSVKETAGEFGFDVPKTPASIRTIPLLKPLVEELKKHRIRQIKFRLKRKKWNDENLVFTNEIGTPINAANLRHRIFYPARDEAKLPKTLRFQDLRGTAVTLALEAGATVKAAQTLLGHTTARLTLEVYAKSTPDSMKDLADKLSAYLGQ